MNRQPSRSPFEKENNNFKKGFAVLVALILLQILVVGVLMLWAPARSGGDIEETGAALNAPPVQVLQSEPVLPVQPVVPTPKVLAPVNPQPNGPQTQPAVADPSLPPVTVRVRGLEVTQGIQVFNDPESPRCNPDPAHSDNVFCNNSMPLIAGRHTLVRLYLGCNGNCPTGETTVQLRLLKEGEEQAVYSRQFPAGELQRVNNLPFNEARLNLGNSLNFEFSPPPQWLAGQITLEAAAGPVGSTPATAVLTREFAVRKPLRVAYVPIQYQGFLPSEPPDIDHWLQRMYPVPAVEYFRLPGADLVWNGELSKGDILRKLLYVYWLYVQNQPLEAWPDQLFGWLPPEYYNGGISDPYWCPDCVGPHSSRVAFGGLRPEQDIGGPRILVHELAHNLGAQHAWSPTFNEDNHCFKGEGVDIRVDPRWPYADTAHIQEFGIDLYSNPPVIYSPSYYDMMAYCTLPWISPHTYRTIFESPFLQNEPATMLPLTDFRPLVQSETSGTLLVSGIVYPDGTVAQPEVIQLAGTAGASFTPPVEFVPPPGDDYCLNVRDEDNSVLAEHCFDVGFVDMETGEMEPSPYFFTLPAAKDVAEVSISKNKVSLVIVKPSNTPPQVTVVFPNGGETLRGRQTIIWQAADADGNPLTYDVLYSSDNGQTWSPLAVRVKESSHVFYADQLPPTYNGLVRVIAHDGFHTAIDESNAPFTIAAPPENSISLRGPTVVKTGQAFEVTVQANNITEPGLFGAQFKLNFDPALLQAASIRIHPDLDLVVEDSIDNQSGQLSVIASRSGQVNNLTGDFPLATVTFTAPQAAGQAELWLSDAGAGARGGVRLEISEVGDLSVRVGQ
jgi:hypothetical protein